MTINTVLVRCLFFSGLLLLTACGTRLKPVSGCETLDNIVPVCRFSNPEDIDLLPDNHSLIISQIGSMKRPASGTLVFYDTVTKALTPAFPLPHKTVFDVNSNWGAANCPGMPGSEFSPLGISVRQRNDGRWQVAATNQGQRVSVEMFELLNENEHYSLEWRGCVIPPDGSFLNDVSLLRNGGFVASHMFDKRDPVIFGFSTGVWKAQLGINTGYVLEWQPQASETFRVLAESHGPFMNGIQLSADDTTVYVSVTSADEVRKLDRLTGKRLASAHVVQPDNLTWDNQSHLLAASLNGGKFEHLACINHPGATCALGFGIVRIETRSMATETIFQHEGAPMGAATVARQVGDALYLGSFSGDRIISIPYSRAVKK
jgi:hypothetical protein